MDIKAYIESGILEAYILGSLPDDEVQLVEANIALFPELGDELLAIEKAMLQLNAGDAIEPPAGLQDTIWDAIQASAPTANTRPDESQGPKTAKVIPLNPEYRKPMQWKYAAIWIALIGSLLVNVMLWSPGRQQKEEREALNDRMDHMLTEQKQLAGLLGDYQKAKGMMADTGMQTIVMHTMQKGHPMAATLYWSKASGEAFVAIDGLPEPPKGMQYQLWVIQAGKPVDMGVLPNNMANTPAMQKVSKPVTNGEAFAITLEKEGCSPVPTMQNLYVLGKA